MYRSVNDDLYHVQRRSSIIHPMIAFRITITPAHKQDTPWFTVQPGLTRTQRDPLQKHLS